MNFIGQIRPYEGKLALPGRAMHEKNPVLLSPTAFARRKGAWRQITCKHRSFDKDSQPVSRAVEQAGTYLDRSPSFASSPSPRTRSRRSPRASSRPRSPNSSGRWTSTGTLYRNDPGSGSPRPGATHEVHLFDRHPTWFSMAMSGPRPVHLYDLSLDRRTIGARRRAAIASPNGPFPTRPLQPPPTSTEPAEHRDPDRLSPLWSSTRQASAPVPA